MPSRERPHKLRRFLAAAHETWMSTPLMVIVDETEPRMMEYKAIGARLLVRPGESIGVSQKVEYAFRQYPDLPWYGFIPDDCEPRTQGWDTALIEACMPDKVAYCSEGLHKIKCGMPVIGGELLRAVGFVAPPGLQHYGGDRFWKSLANRSNRIRILPEHVLRLTDHVEEHDNPAAWDGPKARQKARQSEDKAVWQALREQGFVDKIVARLPPVMNG